MLEKVQSRLGSVPVKINREKLNSLLKSGLNPQVKTRKQLAEKLELDPTSLTRWFATRDRLGNPRYPVVPDRHISNILRVFSLDAECFAMDDEAFHRYCFELALQRQDVSLSGEKKLLTREDKVARRRMSIPMSPMRKRRMAFKLAASGCIAALSIFGWLHLQQDALPGANIGKKISENNCWRGFAVEGEEFDHPDASDPCHYRKLLHRSLAKLKAQNREESGAGQITVDATGDYIAFLSEKLEQRHVREKAIIKYELGRSELHKGNYALALDYLTEAQALLKALPDVSPQLHDEVKEYLAIALHNASVSQ